MEDTGKGRLVAIIGGGNGIGAATARVLKARGWSVAIIDRDMDNARATASELGGRAWHADVTDGAVLAGVAREIEATHAPPYGLVVSSGVFQDSTIPVAQSTHDDWDRLIGVNLDGVFNACKAFGPAMAERGGGAIVNIASTSGMGGGPLFAYGPAKAGVINLTECLAGEWGRAGVRVNAVSPGVTLVPRVRARIQAGIRYRAGWNDNMALGRGVEPPEVGEAVEFLLSDRASAVTGVNLPVDAGWAALRGFMMYGGGRPAPGA